MSWGRRWVVAIILPSLVLKSMAYKLVRFGGAGIYFWWQAGAATYLLEECKNLHSVPLWGASAGSITASLLLSNSSFYNAAKLAIRQTEEKDLWNTSSGLAGVWGPMVREFLNELITEDLSRDELSRIHISMTPRLLVKGTRIATDFADKEDLIDAVMASVHIPLFMDGKLWTTYRGKKYIDGSFWSFLLRRQGRLPPKLRHIDREHILQVDHRLDANFMASQKTSNIVKLIKPEGLYEMMEYGYEYMKKKMKDGALEPIS